MAVNHLAFQHVEKLHSLMLEGREHVRILGQRNEIGLDGDAAGIVVDMAEQAVLMTGASAPALNIHALPRLDEGGAARFLKTAKEGRERHAQRL